MSYFDHAATSPLRAVARQAWVEASTYNPGGQYALGRKARAAVSQAREDIAELLDCEPIEVIFTASGTESNNIALRGLYREGTVLASPIEHPSVAEVLKMLPVRYLPVSASGHVQPSYDGESMITCMLANNETGAIQPVAELASYGVPLHVDAVQAIGHIPVSFRQLGATTLTVAAHKFGGPRVGLLLARRSPALTPYLVGGGQERGIRPGTVDVAGAVATAAALKEACAEMKAETIRLAALRDRIQAGVAGICNTHEPALPGHLSMSFPGALGDSLIMLLDMHGIAASTGSACSNGVNRASTTLLAMGVSEDLAKCTLRFTLGATTTAEDVDKLLAILPEVVSQARTAGL
ncbi:Cysteine desulfurase [Corynebacterium kalinowskii]|uniref:Cysteine desulfurase n=1 Tax=Corynebacterium kalinowskii TaxID=2675216 RepID=A0A6B8VWX9_9CORY|nr:cysteine desulfurase family protein [Corynebacterium kalinowskii]QGU01800.1 Cysteine desulfurase [Corynebacterium kalinowskii]